MAALTFWTNLIRAVTGNKITAAIFNGTQDAIQTEFEARDACFTGHLTAPTLAIDAVNDRVNLTAGGGLVTGKRVGATGYWSFGGSTPLAPGTGYRLYKDNADAFLTPTTTPNSSALLYGTCDWDGNTLSNLAPVTATLGDSGHTHPNLTDLNGYLAAVDRDATKIQGRAVASTAPSNGQVITWDAAGNTWKPGAAAVGYSDEQAQDAVGNALLDTDSIDFTYTDSTDKIKADVKPDNSTLEIGAGVGVRVKALGIGTSHLANDAVDKDKLAADVAGSGLAQNADGSLDVNVANSLEIATDAVQLKGDEASPAADQYYGTDNLGALGYHALPAGLTQEFVEDTVGAMVQATDSITPTYDDAATPAGTLTLDVQVDGSTITVQPGTGLQAEADTALWNAGKLQGKAIADTAPTDQQLMVFDEAEDRWEPRSSPTFDDKKAMVSNDDTTPGYLEDKLAAGDGINLSTANPAGDEDITITNSDRGSTAVTTHEGAYTHHQDNDAATTAPGVTNDTTEGYTVGSRWINTTADTAYVCLDATEGAAVWHQIDAAGSGPLGKYDATDAPTVNEDSGDGYSSGSLWVDETHDHAYICVDATVGAAVWVQIDGGGADLTSYPQMTTAEVRYVVATDGNDNNAGTVARFISGSGAIDGGGGTPYRLTGTGTQFTQDLAVGDYIIVGNECRKISAITSDTILTTTTQWSGTSSGNTIYRCTAPLRTIAAAVAKIPNVVNHNTYVHLAPGTYTEPIDVRGFIGKGILFFYGATTATSTHVVTNVYALDVGCQLQLIGICANTTTNHAFYFGGCVYAYVRLCVATGSTVTYTGVDADGGAFVSVSGGTYSNKAYGIISQAGGLAAIKDAGGTSNTVGIAAIDGGEIRKRNTTVPGGTTAESYASGGLIVGSSGGKVGTN